LNVLSDNRLSPPGTRVAICFRPGRADGDSRGPMASLYYNEWDHEPHSVPEQKNVQQGMSNFEGPESSDGHEKSPINHQQPHEAVACIC
jgi:hypothetical protein